MISIGINCFVAFLQIEQAQDKQIYHNNINKNILPVIPPVLILYDLDFVLYPDFSLTSWT
jgi:hypothetical protein